MCAPVTGRAQALDIVKVEWITALRDRNPVMTFASLL